MFERTILKNGLRIITIPLKNTKAVTVLVVVGAGSKYETKDISGISHFLEHMFFKGTKKRPTFMQIAEALDRVGGRYNAFTGKEYTGYWAKVESKHLDLALDWVSDILLGSRFPSKEMEKEKGVIAEEINMYMDNPQRHIHDLWDKLLYGDQPAGWSIAGEKEVIARFQRKDFLNYMRDHYAAENTIVCVAGNIQEDAVKEKIKQYFKAISTKPAASKVAVVERQKRPACLIHFKKTDQTHLCLGVRGYNLFHPKKYAQYILADILGGSMSSRLFASIREKQGAAYYVYTFCDIDTDAGYLATCAGANHKKVEAVIKSALDEYKKIASRKITKDELQKAKDHMNGNKTLSLESSDAQASFYSFQELLAGTILTPEETSAKINAVTIDDIHETAQDIFRPDKLNLALIGPFKDKDRFIKLLKL